MSANVINRKFTVTEYHQMAERGILSQDERLELIDGEIIEMSPIGSRHAAAVDRLNKLFNRRLPESIIVRVQNPIALAETSEPQPDIVLLPYREDFYSEAHPQPQDILLLVEVADSSVDYDKEVKLPLYAEVGIAEVWLVNLAEFCVEVYRQPNGDRYLEFRQLRPGNAVAPLQFSEMNFSVNDILG